MLGSEFLQTLEFRSEIVVRTSLPQAATLEPSCFDKKTVFGGAPMLG